MHQAATWSKLHHLVINIGNFLRTLMLLQEIKIGTGLTSYVVGASSSAPQPALRIDTTPLADASPEAQNLVHASMSLRRRSSMSPRW